MITEHKLAPEQSPDQPAKDQPDLGNGVTVTWVLDLNVPDPVTKPPWEGLEVVVRVNSPVPKWAVTLLSELITTEHDLMPEQAPDQPVKYQSGLREAVTVTRKFWKYIPAPVSEPPSAGLEAVVKMN